jgi:beta-lactamase regulating signal transducer with metallopeptidase domain
MNLNDFARAEYLVAFAPVVAAALLKGAVILVLGTVCSMMARGATAASRHMIWTLTLGGALAVPVISAIVPRWTLHVGFWPFTAHEVPAVITELTVPAALTSASTNAVLALAPRADTPRRTDASPSPDELATPSVETAERATTMLEVRHVAIEPEASVAAAHVSADTPRTGAAPLIPWLAAVWALGVVIALIPTVMAFARLATVSRRARPLHGGRWALLIPSALRELDVRRRVRFLELDGPVMPMTWGVFRPVVLLPADDLDSTIEQRLDVLRHELAHVRRYDCLTQLVGQLACALHWFNPFAWLAARELRVERERACDDEVLGAGAKASDYADYLLRVARSTRIVGAAALGGLAMARPSQMAGRLLAVLDDRRRRGRVSLWAGVQAGLAAGALVTGVAAASPVSSLAAEPAPALAAVQGNRATTIDNGISVGPVQLDEPARTLAARGPRPPRQQPARWVPLHATYRLANSRPPASRAPCDPNAGHDNGSHTNWINSDNGSKRWVVQWSDGDCSYEMEARGEVKFNRDVTDIESISSGGSFTLEQHIGDDTKRLVVRPAVAVRSSARTRKTVLAMSSTLARGRGSPAALVALDRQTGFAVDQRVPGTARARGRRRRCFRR